MFKRTILSYNSTLDKTFKDFDKFCIGIEDFASSVVDNKSLKDFQVHFSHTKYPPCNIVRVDNNMWMLELAIAGFDKESVDITVENNQLIIKGQNKANHHPELKGKVIYQGIAERDFTKKFLLADNLIVKEASLKCGMLTIYLEAITPDKAKTKKINIS